MAAGDISLAIMITAQNQASSVIQGLARDLGPLGVGMAAIGVGAVAAGVAAVKMAGDYQSATTTLVTGAGESVKNLGMVRQGLLDVSVATGTSTDALVKSMFLVESAGYHGAAGLQVETVAAEGAKVAHSDLAQTADILTTSLHDYNLQATQSVPVMNSLIVSVKNGKMTMDNLNEAMIHVLPVASALHVPLADVEGALSTMAIAGDKGSIAGTHLAMMLKMLANPASTASKEMAKMGIDTIALAQTMETSLPDALIMIQNAVAQHFVPGSVEYNRAIATILGGSKSGIAGLELMGQNMNTLVADTNAAATALRNGGKDVQGWALVQDNFNQKLDQAHAAFDAMFITLGTKMLPVLTDIVQYGLIPFINNLDYIVKNGSPIITWFQGSSLGADALKIALIGLAIAIASVKIGNLVTDMASFVSSVPGMISKIFLVQAAEEATATEATAVATQMSLWGPAAFGAEADVAVASTAMGLSLGGIVTIAAASVAAGVLVVKSAIDTYKQNVKDGFSAPSNTGNGRYDTNNRNSAVSDTLKAAAQNAKDLQAQLKTAQSDMEHLYDYAHSHHNILGDLEDPLALQPADVKLQEIKSHLDDIAKPYEPKIITVSEEAARQKFIEFKTHVDDLKGPVSVGVLTPDVVVARQKVIEFKTHVDDLKGPVAVGVTPDQINNASVASITARKHLDELPGPTVVGVTTDQINAASVASITARKHLDELIGPRYIVLSDSQVNQATLDAMQTKTHLDDLKGPVDILIGYPSLTDANVLAMQTKTHLDDLIGPVNVGVNYGALTQANVDAMNLKTHLDDISNNPVNVNVNTNYSSSGTPPPGGSGYGGSPRAFAGGVENFQGGLAYVHQGEVLMNLSRGTNVIPANKVSAISSVRGGNDKTMNITVQLDSRNMMQALGVRQAKEIRIQGNYRNG